MYEVIKKALAKEFEDKKVQVGTQSFRGDVLIHVDVVVTRGEDTTQKPTASILTKKFFAFILHKTGFNAKNVAKFIQDAMKEANESEMKVDDILEVTEKEMKLFEDQIAEKLPRTPKSGPTKVKGIVRIEKVTPFKEPE